MVGFPELFASQISVSQPLLFTCHLTAVLSAMSNRETQEGCVCTCVRMTSYPELAQGFRLRVDFLNQCYPVHDDRLVLGWESHDGEWFKDATPYC